MLTESYDIASALGYTCPDGTYDCHVKPVPLPRRQFTGVEASVHKRFSNRFQLLASALWSRLEGSYDGNFQASTGQLDPNLNSAYDFADFSVNNDGLLSNDRPWQLKLDGVYHFDLGLAVGLSAYYRSGTPVTAMGLLPSVRLGGQYNLSRRGAFGRTDSEYEAYLHLGYPVRLGGGVVSTRRWTCSTCSTARARPHAALTTPNMRTTRLWTGATGAQSRSPPAMRSARPLARTGTPPPPGRTRARSASGYG